MTLKIVNKRLGKLVLFMAVVAFCIGIIQLTHNTSTVNAWCSGTISPSDNVDKDTQCHTDNWDSIAIGPGDTKDIRRTISFDEFDSLTNECRNYANDERACSNALTNCIQTVVDIGRCKDVGVIRTIAGQFGGCNGGTSLACVSVRDENIKLFQEQEKSEEDAINNVCLNGVDTKGKTDESEKRKACLAAYNAKLQEKGCPTSSYYDTHNLETKYYNEVQDLLNKQKECQQSAAKESATGSGACQALGGLWVEKKNEGNGVSGDSCYENYSDLKNANACAASGMGVWAQEAGKTGDDGWGCHPASEVCSGNGKAKEGWKINDLRNCTEENIKSTDKDDPDAECPKDLNGNCATITATNQHCGDARVNLLGCGEGTKGADAFTAILKIIIIVLTVLVGIAAVGGLAYAALTYARAEDNSGTVSEAKTLIRNIVIGIVLYGFLIAIVTWLVPGLSLT